MENLTGRTEISLRMSETIQFSVQLSNLVLERFTGVQSILLLEQYAQRYRVNSIKLTLFCGFNAPINIYNHGGKRL